MDALEWLRKQLESDGNDVLREMVRSFAEELMSAEADAVCGAAYGRVSQDRVNRRNGYRMRRWDTRVGSIDLRIRKLRAGSYFPDWLLDARRRSERAFIQVVTEAYVRGVSTRRVEGLVEALGVSSLSKSRVSEMASSLDEMVSDFRNRPLDAGSYMYVRADGAVRSIVGLLPSWTCASNADRCWTRRYARRPTPATPGSSISFLRSTSAPGQTREASSA